MYLTSQSERNKLVVVAVVVITCCGGGGGGVKLTLRFGYTSKGGHAGNTE